ncbi:RNA helicase aquarius-like isoform X2 [Xenia sp. Carnegie-2017]|uniref:RNA helicase aquarius-like isoform X2 n=1 Tax=Xenia sp. Carnegie-2017 TaxID=2897299 RepID=UPI001F03F627|nr:RNA helicase aquarius-like isoform X2 [Xenia sp. Carnegie-2017]
MVKDKGKKERQGGFAPTIQQINADILTQIANTYWAPHQDHLPYDPRVIEKIYEKDLLGCSFSIQRIMLLEFSQYLENFLWPNFNSDKASLAHVMSIVVMVNEKFRESVPPWEIFKSYPEQFQGFFQRVLDISILEESVSIKEKVVILHFLIHCFSSLEVDVIRKQVQQLVSLPMWSCLLPGRLQQELKRIPKYRKYWAHLNKKDAKCDENTLKRLQWERLYLSNLIKSFFNILDSMKDPDSLDKDKIHFSERFLELLVDLEALLPTRRFFNTVLDDAHVVERCSLSFLAKEPKKGKLFTQLLDMLRFYAGFEINDVTGSALTDHEMVNIHYCKITSLQRAAFKNFPELYNFSLSNVASVDTREALLKQFEPLEERKLHDICAHLNLLPKLEDKQSCLDKDLLLEILISRHERRLSQIDALNNMPLYPTEQILWDENIVPSQFYSGEECLALPKLNLQFLTLHDYLLRNLNLFRLESTYEIRQDIEDVVKHMRPWSNEIGHTEFRGWARMSLPISSFTVVEVAKPNIGENRPSRVRADVTIDLNLRREIKAEWESIRKHDVIFLVCCRPAKVTAASLDPNQLFKEKYGIDYVRGAEIEGMLDEEGKIIEDGPEPKPEFKRDTRTFRLWLDTNQYQQDMTAAVQGKEDVYETFNIVIRRKPKENNFKAVLETIRDLMNTECIVPDWLHDIFLGYDDPGSAHYTRMPNQIKNLNFNDTFLNMEHLKASFPKYSVKAPNNDADQLTPPFKITFPEEQDKSNKNDDVVDALPEIIVEPFVTPNRGPYPYNQPKRNAIPFTPTQVEAIRSGMQPGLTMVVGPPGTGKTDVAVQIISNLYHNFPEQRTLIVTHSNQALNQLFEKIMALDVDERHLLRLGHGEEALETEKDFSRYGRVNFVLAKRLELLAEVQRLQESLKVHGDVSYTCETAGYFFLYQVVARWEEFSSKLRKRKNEVAAIAELFPFTSFFSNAPQPVFKGKTWMEDMEIAEGCYRYIKRIFQQLEEFRAFELLRSGADRSNYLLVKEAKIIAMTCTHAALKRRDLVELGFKYDNVLMEEAAQILEIETFIPLLLQTAEDGFNRLKRVTLIGDHHQLPPVIKNMAFQKFSNMEQSLFTRFVRLGVPTVDLDAQGRARPSLCNLYNWRYKKLGNLQHVFNWPEYCTANPGFLYDFQLINVEDFNGVGESEPNPYFYQNLGEAEYAAAIFMFMRLLGYPAEKIAILTTYNGQKHLIRDVIRKRCAENPLIGWPSKITTVDRYQGQQNDYIILSLVRTRTIGHIRDVRRLVVAMSRARLGLYILARVNLFRNCFELTPAFDQLTSRPLNLVIALNERYPSQRSYNAAPTHGTFSVKDMPHMHRIVYDMYQTIVSEMNAQQQLEQQQQSIPQPPQTEARTTQGKEEMEQSIVPEASQPSTESMSMSEDPPGSPIINEVEEEDVM